MLMKETPIIDDEENEIQMFVYEDSENLYEVDFLKKKDYIIIKCSHTSRDSDIKYSYKLYADEIKRTTSCNSISNFINKLQEFRNELKIEKIGDIILLEIILDKYKKEIKTVKLEGYDELEGEINNLEDAIKMIKILIKENKKLKNDFKEYKNKMELNFAYNSLDINSYKLDDIFKTISCNDIIQNRDEFGLINMGFQHIFKKNIIYFQCIYKSTKKEYDNLELKKMFIDHKFLVIVILTKNKKRFGAFFENDINNQMNDLNNIMNNNMNNMNMNMNMNNNNMNNMNMNMNNNNMNNNNMNNMNNMINKIMINKIMNNMNNNNMSKSNINNNIMNNNNMNNNNMNMIKNIMSNNNMSNNNMNNNNMNNNIGNVNFGAPKPMINNNNNMNNTIFGNTPEETIFNSTSCSKDYFVFSLDNMQIFYSNNQENKEIPKFYILYDTNRQSLYGKEVQNNQNMQTNSMSFQNQYKLSDQQEFNVKDFELYNVEVGKL